jgi:1-acyl-sn-glycerol-3-phosphate acyltransferase
LLRLDLRIRGMPALGPTLYVANHVSWLDIPCLLALIDATFVAKDEVARWPLVGDLAAQVGTIFFPRGEGQAQAAAERMMWHLTRRRSVMFFPEGTTTDGTTVRHFHSRLFQAATRTGTSVQPIAIRYMSGADISRVAPFIGDDDLLRHLWRLLGEKRIVAHVQMCAPCPPGSDRRALARHTRALVCATLAVEAEQRRARA